MDRTSCKPAARSTRTRAAPVETGMRSLRPENLPPDNLLRESLRPDNLSPDEFRQRSLRLREHDESVTSFYSSAGRHDPADGWVAFGGPGGLLSTPSFRASRG